MAREGLRRCIKAMLSGKFDIVILDEVCMANFFKLLTLDELVEVISQKPPNLELIFTRGMLLRSLLTWLIWLQK
ncbi:MAG: cob(I)yrinic acid a,c-diamide adenosyltransferase [Clostridia bacterium]|nr:cob(I)yrinic acid a,c-diamide adenosyltransferase [Clostridia bacterium]